MSKQVESDCESSAEISSRLDEIEEYTSVETLPVVTAIYMLIAALQEITPRLIRINERKENQ